MITNSTYRGFIIIFSFVFIFPIIQKQWYNLYLFDKNGFSLSHILYYLSGIICPLFVSLYSLKNFTIYKFKNIKLDSKELLQGKNLLIIILLTLIPLSILVSNYIYINLDLILNIFFNTNLKLQTNHNLNFYLSIIILIFLIFKTTRILVKKIVLLNFFLISFILWYLQVNNIFIDNNLLIKKLVNIENLNIVNISFLLIIETIYYFWTFISYRNNLSDWSIIIPQKRDIYPVHKTIIFYLFIIVYYLILKF